MPLRLVLDSFPTRRAALVDALDDKTKSMLIDLLDSAVALKKSLVAPMIGHDLMAICIVSTRSLLDEVVRDFTLLMNPTVVRDPLGLTLYGIGLDLAPTEVVCTEPAVDIHRLDHLIKILRGDATQPFNKVTR